MLKLRPVYSHFSLKKGQHKTLEMSLISIYAQINNTINKSSFIQKHRLSETAFTRNRSLNFPTLMLYLLNLRKHSNQVELDQFFKTLNAGKEAAQIVTKSAFFQTRKQLSHTAFTSLNQEIIDAVYKRPKHLKTWKSFRLCAIDGTSLRLPNTPDITRHFGIQKGRAGQTGCTMGMASVFYDVLNHLVIDSCIHPRSKSEKSCIGDHMEHASENDLIIYDRGYPAFWLYAFHIKHKHSFCMRAKTQQSLVVKDFIKSNKKQAIVTIKPNKPSIQTCLDKGLSSAPIKLRLVRVDLPNEVEVLITNLMDTEAYEAGIFKSLYHLRWGIEENYKRLKQWVEIENFSGKSALSVQQDFHAKIIASNLTALMTMAAQKEVDKRTRELRLSYQVNFAQALSKMKHQLVTFIRHTPEGFLLNINRAISYIATTVEAVREGRSAPRLLKNIKNDIHFPAYKSSL